MFTALIPGYGVPKDILTDRNYNSYLAVCFNTLFDRFRDDEGTIVVSGGPTDCYPPFERTEANEMERWLETQIRLAEMHSSTKLRWTIKTDNEALTTIENVLYFKPVIIPSSEIVVFADKTRADRMNRFVEEVLDEKAEVIPVDFDTSTNRYNSEAIVLREQRDLEFSLKAINDPRLLEIRREFAKRKVEEIRKLGAEKGHEKLPEILERLYQEFKEKYNHLQNG